jgi:hypothetical protein
MLDLGLNEERQHTLDCELPFPETFTPGPPKPWARNSPLTPFLIFQKQLHPERFINQFVAKKLLLRFGY